VAAKAFQIMGKKTGAFEAVESDDLAMLKAESLAKFDAVLMDNCTSSPDKDKADLITDEELKKSILAFVSVQGKGWIGIHAATDCNYHWPEYGEMMGGYFNGHPFRRISVKLDDPGSPLTAPFREKGFQIEDEIYTFKEPYSREKLHVLLSLDWEHSHLERGTRSDNDYALSWIHEYGKGRVFYCAFGHDDAIFWNPAILKHYLAGLQYVLGDLKADATPTAKLQSAPKPARGPDLEKTEEKKADLKPPSAKQTEKTPDGAKSAPPAPAPPK
jgi:type 1 glutamine amidotransferase